MSEKQTLFIHLPTSFGDLDGEVIDNNTVIFRATRARARFSEIIKSLRPRWALPAAAGFKLLADSTDKTI